MVAAEQGTPRCHSRIRPRNAAAQRVVTNTPYIIVFVLWDNPAVVVITATADGIGDR